MTDIEKAYFEIERCRKKLMRYEWSNAELRNEAWQAELEMYEIEQRLLDSCGEDCEPATL